MNVMDVIPYEENSFYIFDRGYNDFERLFRINAIGAYFKKRKFIFFINALDISPMMVAELYHNRWQIELFKWLKQHLKIKKFWGGVRERREDPNIHRNNRLLYDGNRAEKDGKQQAYL